MAALGAGGCRKPASGLRVLVTTDFVPGSTSPPLHSVVLRVRSGTGLLVAPPLKELTVRLDETGANLPLAFNVFLPSGTAESVILEAEAHTLASISAAQRPGGNPGAPVTVARVVTGFVEGEVRVVPMVLYRGCWDWEVRCRLEETCGPQGTCESAARNPGSLPVYNPDAGDLITGVLTPDAAVPSDVATVDATVPMDATGPMDAGDAGGPRDGAPGDAGACRVVRTPRIVYTESDGALSGLTVTRLAPDSGVGQYRVAWTAQGVTEARVRTALVRSSGGAMPVITSGPTFTTFGQVSALSATPRGIAIVRPGVSGGAMSATSVLFSSSARGFSNAVQLWDDLPATVRVVQAVDLGPRTIVCFGAPEASLSCREVALDAMGAATGGPEVLNRMLSGAPQTLLSVDGLTERSGSHLLHAVLGSTNGVSRCYGEPPSSPGTSIPCQSYGLPSLDTRIVAAVGHPVAGPMGTVRSQTTIAWRTTMGGLRLEEWPVDPGVTPTSRSISETLPGDDGGVIALSVVPDRGALVTYGGPSGVWLYPILNGSGSSSDALERPASPRMPLGVPVAATRLPTTYSSATGTVYEHVVAYPIVETTGLDGGPAPMSPNAIAIEVVRVTCP